MKKVLIAITILTAFAALAFTFQQNKIVGRWEGKLPDKTVGGMIYKTDHTFQAYVHKKVFVSGNFELKNDTLTLTDVGCPVKGVYKVTFFADSVRCNLIADTCSGRKHDVDKSVLGRVKAVQKLSK